MYVIYINDRPLRLCPEFPSLSPTSDPRTCGTRNNNQHLTARYTGKRRTLLHYVDMLEKSSKKVTSVDLTAPDVEQLWQDFRGHYKIVEAAGGVVRHTGHGKLLFLFRRGWWDLPKGKLDEGETPAEAALREVEEETGVTDLRLGVQLPTTYHTYRTKKGKRVLKPTYWFDMASSQDELTPEEEEDIERAEWHSIAEIVGAEESVYANLLSLLDGLAK